LFLYGGPTFFIGSSVHLPLVALPERAAQLALEYLARAADWQRLLADLNAPRALVIDIAPSSLS
jgi:hypothetical protein